MSRSPRHHHGYVCSQFRHRTWFTRHCQYPFCGVITLTWRARVLFLGLGVVLAVVLV